MAFLHSAWPVDMAVASNSLPVVLVHGQGGNSSSWETFRWVRGMSPHRSSDNWTLYECEGHVFDDADVYLFEYSKFDGAHGDIPMSAGLLSEGLREVRRDTAAEDVFIVAHSMGGLLARTYMEGLAVDASGRAVPYGDDVAGFVTLNSPHRGCWLSTTLRGEAATFFRGLDPSASQMAPDSAVMQLLNSRRLPGDADYSLVAGNHYYLIGDGLLGLDEQQPPPGLAPKTTELAVYDVVHSETILNWWWDVLLGWRSAARSSTKIEVLDSSPARSWTVSEYLETLAHYRPTGQASQPGATSLVFDVSTSMNDSFDYGSKLDMAKEAGKTVVDIIDGAASGVEIGVVQFSEGADEVLSPTSSASDVKSAISGLGTIGGTDILSAVRAGADQLSGSSGTRVMILLSDGQDTAGNDPDDILRTAEQAKRSGITIYTIGFGDPGQIDEELLRHIASSPDTYSLADPNNVTTIVGDFMRSQVSATEDILFDFTGTVAQGETVAAGTFAVPETYGDLQAILYWPGSTLELKLYDPDGSEVTSGYPGYSIVRETTPAQVFVEGAKPGDWRMEVYGADVSMPQEPFYAMTSFKESSETPAPTSGGGGGSSGGGGSLVFLAALALLAGVGVTVYQTQKPRTKQDADDAIRNSSASSDFALRAEDGTHFALSRGANAIGRASDNDIVIDDQSVSRHHTLLSVGDKRVRIKDLASRAGTLVNGERTAETEIRPGDTIRLGSVKLELASGDHGPASGG